VRRFRRMLYQMGGDIDPLTTIELAVALGTLRPAVHLVLTPGRLEVPILTIEMVTGDEMIAELPGIPVFSMYK
jgi:hypothetical protein